MWGFFAAKHVTELCTFTTCTVTSSGFLLVPGSEQQIGHIGANYKINHKVTSFYFLFFRSHQLQIIILLALSIKLITYTAFVLQEIVLSDLHCVMHVCTKPHSYNRILSLDLPKGKMY